MLNKAGRLELSGGSDRSEEDAGDVNKERLAFDKEDVAAFVPLIS